MFSGSVFCVINSEKMTEDRKKFHTQSNGIFFVIFYIQLAS